MKLHWAGEYNLDPASLPHAEPKPNAVPFREAENTKKLAVIANVIALVLLAALAAALFVRLRGKIGRWSFLVGALLSLLTMLPHEVLHAACFVEDVYLYTNLKQGMLFVTGPEDMSRGRFVGMSLLPNLVFGIVPYAIGFALRLPTLGYFGAFCISMGAGDYYNIFNALTQMPRGARTYIDGFRSYWYLP